MDISTFLSSRSEVASSQETPFLGALSKADFQKVLSGGETRLLDEGAILVGEGEQDTSLYILLEGEVEVLVPTLNGWIRVAILGERSVIGELAFLDNLPRSAKVTARAPCSVLRITRESFQEFAQREPILALIFVWELSQIVTLRLRRVEQFDAAEVAREQERRSLAEELHDDTMVDLAGFGMELALMKRMTASTLPDLAETMEELRVRLRGTDRRLREIVQGIFPSALTMRGLMPALTSFLSDLSSRTILNPYPLEIELRATGFDTDRLAENIEIGVYRVIQQGVDNAIKHAQAKKILIDLVWSEPELTFSLSDDGRGFDVSNPKESPSTGHFGLVNLRDRIEGLQGTFEIESQPSVGTTMRAKVPVPGNKPRPRTMETSIVVLNNQEPDG